MDSLVRGESLGMGDVTPERLATEIGLTEEEIAWRKEFVKFDDGDVERMHALEPLVEENIDDLVDAFIDPIYEEERTKDVLDRSPRDREAMRAIVAAYYRTLTSGAYDRDHYTHRTRIGRLHDRLDMPLHYFAGMFGRVSVTVAGAAMDDARAELREKLAPEDAAVAEGILSETEATVAAALRALNLDMQVVNDTYLHSYAAEMREEIERSRELRAKVGAEAEALGENTDRVAGGIEEVEGIAADQRTQAAELSNEADDMGAVIEEVAASAEEVAATAEEAAKHAEAGREAVDEVGERMDGIDEAHDQIDSHVEQLVSAVDEIEGVVEVIDGLAEQTNLLALNASIEAARAGEEGAGFAVVADEVKSLADESKTQAGRVEEIIEDVTDHIDEADESLSAADTEISRGVEAADHATDRLSSVEGTVEEAAAGIAEVATATDEGASAAAEISAGIDVMAGNVGDVAEELSGIAGAVESQARTASDLNAAVNSLRTDEADVSLDSGVRDRTAADGGFERPEVVERTGATETAAGGGDRSDDPTDRIPDAVLESLPPETVERIRNGEAERPGF